MKASLTLRLLCCAGAAAAMGTSVHAADTAVEQVSVRAIAHFDFNGAGIRPRDRDAILAEVGAMKNVTWQTVTTTGYTDSVGSAGYNERLGARRAEVVKRYLVGKGLDRSMIESIGKGEADPIANNESAEGRARNRRAEIEFRGIRTAAK